MISQVIFKIDSKIKKEALKKSKKEGIALSSILKLAMQDFVSGKSKLSMIQADEDKDLYGSMEQFRQASYDDVLKTLGKMSKKEYDYYENLPPK